MYAALAEETFAPVINRTSKHIAESLDPIHERQESEQQRRQDRLAQLRADVEEERRREETFAPKTATLPPGMSMEHRLPLADRSNATYRSKAMQAYTAEGDTTPVINARSAEMVSQGAARAHVDEANRIRKQIQTLWVTHSDGANAMRRVGALACLHDLGVTSGSTTEKFLLALGFVQGPNIAREEHVLTVDYDRFNKVLTAVLRAASAATAAMNGSKADEGRINGARSTSVVGRQQQDQSRQPSALRRGDGDAKRTMPATTTQSRPLPDPRTAPSTASTNPPPHQDQLQATRNRSVSKSVRAPRRQHSRSPSATTTLHATSSSRSPSAARNKARSLSSQASSTKERGMTDRSLRATTTTASSRSGDSRDVSPNRRNFTPRINHDAVPLNRGAVSRPAMRDETRERLTALKAERAERELSACTFRPKILDVFRTSGTSSSVLHDPRRRTTAPCHSPSPQAPGAARAVTIGFDDDEEDPFAREEDDDLSEAHRFSKSKHSHRTSRSSSTAASNVDSSAVASTMLGVTPGFESAVQRMQRARKQRRPTFEESLRGGRRAYATDIAPPTPSPKYHVDPNASPSKSAADDGPTTTEVSPFHLRTDERSAERELAKPLLYVDVDLPHGKTARIGVHRGDTAEALARSFCVSYSLDDDTMFRLTDILQVKIDSVVQERTRTLWV